MNHIPVSNMAFNTVNKIMDKYEPKHKGAWAHQTLAHHTTHALDHILSFNKSIFEGPTLTSEQIEDVESCLVRCAFILTNIKRGPIAEASPIAGALDSVVTSTVGQQESDSQPKPEVQPPPA
jgi:hypothetical protein